MRTRATIATHDASKLKFPLSFKASSVEHTQIHALGKDSSCDAASLIQKLKDERNALKMKKKRQPKTGLYKYVTYKQMSLTVLLHEKFTAIFILSLCQIHRFGRR